MEEATRRLFDFNSPEELPRWEAVNNGSQGGASEGALAITAESVASFEGTVSLEGGGFASVRTIPQPFGLSGYDGLRILARGDGKRYRVRLSMQDDPGGAAYEHAFATKARVWTTVVVPFRGCVPTLRRRDMPDEQGLVADAIRSIGLMIADGQDGPFRLDVDWIDAYAELESGRV